MSCSGRKVTRIEVTHYNPKIYYDFSRLWNRPSRRCNHFFFFLKMHTKSVSRLTIVYRNIWLGKLLIIDLIVDINLDYFKKTVHNLQCLLQLYKVFCKTSPLKLLNKILEKVSGKMPPGKKPPGKMPPRKLPPEKLPPGNKPPEKIAPRKITPQENCFTRFCCF